MREGPELANAPVGYSVDLGERVRLMRDSLINNSYLLVSAPVGIILVPIMLKGLGSEAYGLWVAASALGSLVWIDFGIQASTTRVVAGDRVSNSPEEMPHFVKAAWSANLALGFLTAAVIGAFGLALTTGLHLTARTVAIAPLIIALTGLNYWGSHLLTFLCAVLNGLRRFDVSNYISVGNILSTAIGIIAVLRFGGGLLEVVVWQVVANWILLLVAVQTVHYLEPRLTFGLGKFKWAWLRPYVAFGFWSQLSDFAKNGNLQASPLVIGTVLNSAAISPFAVGQKFPTAVSRIQGRAMDVIYPAASQAEHCESAIATRHLLEVATRWGVVLLLPLYLGLLVIARPLLQAWMGDAPSETATVLLVLCVSMAIAALGGGAEQVIWGRGDSHKVFWVNAAALGTNLAVTFPALHRFGVPGAAWGFLASMTVRSIAFLVLGSRTVEIGVWGLLRSSLKGIFLPLTACGVVAWGVVTLHWPGKWLGILLASAAGGMAYLGTLYFGGARPEEHALARELLMSPITIPRLAWRGLRKMQHRIGPKYRAYIFLESFYRVLIYNSKRETANIEALFESKEDPYGALTPPEQERFRYELEMLEGVRGGGKFKRALEIGCGEGTFTKLLAPLCESLVALDNSPIALGRARKRCAPFTSIEFRQYDMRVDPLPDAFDLIVVVALSNLILPREYERICTLMVDALRPGGYLLVGDFRDGYLRYGELRGREVFENSWWGKWLFLGGKWILEYIGQNPNLKKVGEYNLDPWMHTLFRKTQPKVAS